VSIGEITLWIFGLLFMVDLFGRFEDLICKALQSITTLGFVLSLGGGGVENTDLVQETFKLSWLGLVLLVAMWLLYVGYGMV
jgi:hypothetical protein